MSINQQKDIARLEQNLIAQLYSLGESTKHIEVTDIEPFSDYVLLKLVKEEKSKVEYSHKILDFDYKEVVRLGPKVPDDCGVRVGQRVVTTPIDIYNRHLPKKVISQGKRQEVYIFVTWHEMEGAVVQPETLAAKAEVASNEQQEKE